MFTLLLYNFAGVHI